MHKKETAMRSEAGSKTITYFVKVICRHRHQPSSYLLVAFKDTKLGGALERTLWCRRTFLELPPDTSRFKQYNISLLLVPTRRSGIALIFSFVHLQVPGGNRNSSLMSRKYPLQTQRERLMLAIAS